MGIQGLVSPLGRRLSPRTGRGEGGEKDRALRLERLCLGPSSRGGWCLMAPFLGGDDQNLIKPVGDLRRACAMGEGLQVC